MPITIYSSTKDKALLASRNVHAYSRLGYGAPEIFVYPPFETIDASEVDTDWLSHSYYGSSPVMLKDIGQIIGSSKNASQRFLKTSAKNGQTWWVLP